MSIVSHREIENFVGKVIEECTSQIGSEHTQRFLQVFKDSNDVSYQTELLQRLVGRSIDIANQTAIDRCDALRAETDSTIEALAKRIARLEDPDVEYGM
jgi:hypothetical protein